MIKKPQSIYNKESTIYVIKKPQSIYDNESTIYMIKKPQSIYDNESTIYMIHKGFSLWFLTPLSVISWRSVLMVKETGVPGENHRAIVTH